MDKVRGMKLRIYPNKSQQKKIDNTLNCCRFIYNYMLERNNKIYKRRKEHLYYYDMQNLLPKIKKYFVWLKDADSQALRYACRQLDCAYKKFFDKENDYPKFKKKSADIQSYTTTNPKTIHYENKKIKIPLVGWIKVRGGRKLTGKICYATVSKTKTGKYFISITYKQEVNNASVSINKNNIVGLDYKSNGLYVDSNGNYCNMPHFFRNSQNSLKMLNKRLLRKIHANTSYINKKGQPVFKKRLQKCNNIKKQISKIAKLSEHISNQRKDFLHKQSTVIAKQFDIVCVENLSMENLANKGFGNGKATMDNGYGMFLNYLRYKLEERGKMLIKVDKFFPSSQICSKCGYQNKEVKNLQIRKWKCPICGAEHDRDINAAINIRNEGKRMIQENLIA